MLDWDDLRYFLAIARHGNLVAAAKELRVAQSTVGRRLASLEANLGTRLLNRTPEGYVPTLAGNQVRREAERFETGSMALERDIGGRDTRLSGSVRVTCAESVASHIISPCLAAMHSKHPDIMVELIPDPREPSLSMREADISVRLKQSNQHDLVVRKVGILGFGLYASPDYLDKHGELAFEAGCPGHHIVAQVDDLQDSEQTGWLASLASRSRIALQTSSHEAAVVAALHGGGLACPGPPPGGRSARPHPPGHTLAGPGYGYLAGRPQGQPQQRAHPGHPHALDGGHASDGAATEPSRLARVAADPGRSNDYRRP